MTKRILITAGLLFSFACSVAAATGGITSPDINGKWSGAIPTPRGDTLDVTFDFKAEGEKLTGTVHAQGEDFPLAQGKVKGDAISFKIEGDTPDYTGKISGDEIQMKEVWRSSERGTRIYTFTLKRVKT